MILSAVQRRHTARWPCHGDAEIVFSMELPTVHAKIADLSAEGCLLIAKQPVKLDTDVRVEIAFTVNRLPFRVRALMKVGRSETVYGFQFSQVSSRSQRRLLELVEELEQAQREHTRGFKGSGAGIELS